MSESETIKEILEWIEKRIQELPDQKSKYYQNLKESFEWELKTSLERESDK